MNRLALLVGASALALAGCSSSSSTGPGSDGPGSDPVDEPEISDSGGASGVSITASEEADGTFDIGEATTATADYDLDDSTATLEFTGGDLDGETITFDTESGEAVSGVGGSQEGFLTDISGDHSVAVFVEVTDDSSSAFNALHTGADISDMPDSGTVTYSGQLVGAAASVDDGVAGDARGSVAITADFDNESVEGTISGIGISDGEDSANLGDVGFEAAMDADNATYGGSDVTIGGNDATGLVDGGFYGPDAAETAGGVTAANEDGALIGAFGAAR